MPSGSGTKVGSPMQRFYPMDTHRYRVPDVLLISRLGSRFVFYCTFVRKAELSGLQPRTGEGSIPGLTPGKLRVKLRPFLSKTLSSSRCEWLDSFVLWLRLDMLDLECRKACSAKACDKDEDWLHFAVIVRKLDQKD